MANPETSDLPEVFATDAADAVVEVEPGQAGEHIEPSLLGLEPYQWVSIAMVALLLIAFGMMKVHKTIAGGLDGKIAAIKANLDEAKQLRAEAEALREEYAAKIAGAEKDAEAMLENARREADGIVAKAEEDTAAMIARRERMAQDKIAAAERQAIADLKARAADASTAAAAQLIAANHDAAADKALADEVIANI
ncbi:ATP synthase subunit B [Aurantiacibacter gangjinensis]|uniref:ATP synthase subunit b n=1 Tax=Aurantiacibacter gangjinensis TaxID=502682 RepID=A0A0G9MTQ4_9SPHN|nr:ATP synthase subunit B [Aurantiacibacter gangjinensis]APE28462.1 ATP synthase F0 sector subunit b [Aurantiacibacter gangjinensis]KLE32673.1 ATP synthase subunit B [Aurantiacibacter gangjinensis]